MQGTPPRTARKAQRTSSWTRLGIALLLGVLSVLLVASPGLAQSDGQAHIGPDLEEKLEGSSTGLVAAIVEMAEPVDLETVETAHDIGLDTMPPLNTLPRVFAIQGPAEDVASFIDTQPVTTAEWNRPLTLQHDSSRVAAGIASVVDRLPGQGGPMAVDMGDGSKDLDGSGVGIAIVDSGIDATHPDLEYEDKVVENKKFVCSTGPFLVWPDANQYCLGNWAVNNPDLATGTCTSEDDPLWIDAPHADTSSGHGTHVASTAAGTGAASDGLFAGAAPGAKLYGLGMGDSILIFHALSALDWVACHAQDAEPPIKVVNNSYGVEGCAAGAPSQFQQPLLELLIQNGVTPVYAAGNDGGDGSEQCTNTFAATDLPGVIMVANYDDRLQGTIEGDLSDTSSRGAADDENTWPDLSAPGTFITGARAKNTGDTVAVGTVFTDMRDPVNYMQISGTSMAAPHVAGAVALLHQVNPGLEPGDVETLLTSTAHKFQNDVPYEGTPSSSYDKGHGLMDVRAAIEEVTSWEGSRTVADLGPDGTWDLSGERFYLETGPNGLGNTDADYYGWAQEAPTAERHSIWHDHEALTNTNEYTIPAMLQHGDLVLDGEDVNLSFWVRGGFGTSPNAWDVTFMMGDHVETKTVQTDIVDPGVTRLDVTFEDITAQDTSFRVAFDSAFINTNLANTLLYGNEVFPTSIAFGTSTADPVPEDEITVGTVCINADPTDCHETIQEAIDASDPGDDVVVNPGTYEEAIDIHKPVTVTAQYGSELTTIESPDGTAVSITAPGAAVEGFEVISQASLGGALVHILADDATVEGNEILGDHGIVIEGDDAAIVANRLEAVQGITANGERASLDANVLQGAGTGTGIHLTGSAADVSIWNNELSAYALQVHDEGEASDLGRVFEVNEYDRAVLIAGEDEVLSDAIYGTLQAATASAPSDADVIAKQGTYEGPIILEKPGLTLCSTFVQATCSGGADATIQASFGSDIGVSIDADDVTLTGFTIDVPTQGGTAIDATGADRVTLRSNEVNVGIPDGEFGLQAAMDPQHADYWLNPFVEEVLTGDTLATITGQRADDEGFLGAQPAHEPNEHIALLYRSQAPAEAHQMAEASEDPKLRIYEGIEPTPLMEDLGEDGFYTVSQDHELEGPLAPSPVEGIGPGTSIQISRPDGTFGCTANFVFQDDTGQAYLGTAGHCVLPSGISSFEDPNWRQEDISVSYCEQPFFNTVARVCWATGDLGDVAFAMQDDGAGNQFGFDFALIEIPDHYLEETPDYCDETLHEHCGEVRPWMPVWGGPTGATLPVVGDAAVHYGHGVGVGATFPTEARAAVPIFQDGISFDALGWVTGGDSGSGISTAADRTDQMLVGDEAFGDITHSIVVVGAPLMLGTTLDQGMSLAQEIAGVDVELVLENEELQVPGIDAPFPPEEVAVLDVSTSENAILEVSWELPEESPPADAYDVYLEGANDPLVENVTATSYQDVDATDGEQRCYEIVAKNDGGESSRSQPACGTPSQPDLPPPAFVHVLDRGNGDEVSVIWGTPEEDVTFDGYHINRTAPGGDAEITTVDADTQAFVDDELDEGVEYTYEVRLVKGNDTSEPIADAAVPTTNAPTWAQAQGAPTGAAYTGAAGSITAPGLQDSLPLASGSTAPPLAEDLTADGSIEILIVENMEDANDDIVVRALSLDDGTLDEVWSHTIAKAQPFDGPPTEGFGTAAIGDLTGDGDQEVAVYTNHILNLQAVTGNAGKLTVLDGATGDALDSDAESITIGTDIPPRLVDLNGDGSQEIVFVQQVGGAEPGYYLQAQAVTNDGDLQLLFDELVTPDRVHAPPALLTQDAGTTSVALGDNAGDVFLCKAEDEGSWSVDCSTLTNVGSAVRGISQGRMEATDQPTVVAHTSNGNVATITLDPDGTTASLDVAVGLWTPPSVADLDGDAFTEIASAPANGFIDDTEQRGDVSFSGIVDGALTELGVLERVPSDASAHAPGGGIVADITGDGSLEVLVGDEDGRIVAISPALADGEPAVEWTLPLGGSITAPLAVADVTGDGALSIVAIAGDELVVVDSVIDAPSELIGIDLEGASDALIQNNILHASGDGAGSIGIQASGASVPNVVIAANTIEGGNVTIVLNDAPRATVSNNDVTKLAEGPGYGINIAGDDVSIVDNILTSTFDNTEHVTDHVDGFETVNQFALRISGNSENATILGNTIQNWANMGIIMTGSAGDGGLIEANAFQEIRWHPISLEGPREGVMEVRQNTFKDSYRGISLSGVDASGVEIRSNTFDATLVEALRVSDAHEGDIIDARLNAWSVVGEEAIQTRVNDEGGTNEVLVRPYLDAAGNAHPPLPEVRCDKGDGFEPVTTALSLQDAIDLELPAACGPFQSIEGHRQILLGASFEHYDPATVDTPVTLTENPETLGVDQRATPTPAATIQATDRPALTFEDGSEESRVLHLTLGSAADAPGIHASADGVSIEQSTFLGEGPGLTAQDASALTVGDSTFLLSGSQQAAMDLSNVTGATIHDNLVNADQLPGTIGIQLTDSEDPALLDNIVIDARIAYRLADATGATLEDNIAYLSPGIPGFGGTASGMVLFGGADHTIERSLIAGADEGIVVHGVSDVDVNQTRIVGADTGIRLDARSFDSDQPMAFSANNTNLVLTGTALELTDDTALLDVDVTCVNWGVYHGTLIEQRISDDGAGNDIEYQPWTSANQDDPAAACLTPPEASFDTTVGFHQASADDEETYTRLDTFSFEDGSDAGTREIVQWRWDLGDGTQANRTAPQDPDVEHGYDALGTFPVVLTVEDADGMVDRFIEDVSIENLEPTLEPFSKEEIHHTEDINLPVTATDPEGDAITLSADGPAGVTLEDNGDGTGTLGWDPTPEQFGEFAIEVTATDDHGDTDTETFLVTVENLEPTLDVPEQVPGALERTITFDVHAESPDEDPITGLTADLEALPEGHDATFETKETGQDHTAKATFTWTPTSQDAIGQHDLDVTVESPGHLITKTVLLDVRDEVPPPDLTLNAPAETPEGSTLEVTATADVDEDAENDIATWDATAESLTDSEETLLEGTLTTAGNDASWEGTVPLGADSVTVTFTADDGLGETSASITTLVQLHPEVAPLTPIEEAIDFPTNRPLHEVSPLTLRADASDDDGSITSVAATITATDGSTTGTTVTLDQTDTTLWAATLTPGETPYDAAFPTPGDYDITIEATDDDGLETITEQEITLETHQPPSVGMISTERFRQAEGPAGSTLEIQATPQQPDDRPLEPIEWYRTSGHGLGPGDEEQVGQGSKIQVTAPVGINTYEARLTDAYGAQGTNTMTVYVWGFITPTTTLQGAEQTDDDTYRYDADTALEDIQGTITLTNDENQPAQNAEVHVDATYHGLETNDEHVPIVNMDNTDATIEQGFTYHNATLTTDANGEATFTIDDVLKTMPGHHTITLDAIWTDTREHAPTGNEHAFIPSFLTASQTLDVWVGPNGVEALSTDTLDRLP